MNPDKKRVKLAEERTALARERTELAEERTILADMRTGVTFILFGITFLGLAAEAGVVFSHAGILAIIFGAFIVLLSIIKRAKNQKEIKAIKAKIRSRRNNLT